MIFSHNLPITPKKIKKMKTISKFASAKPQAEKKLA